MPRRFTNRKKQELGNMIVEFLVEEWGTITPDEIKRTALHLYNRSRDPNKWEEFVDLVKSVKEERWQNDSESERYQAR